MENESASSIQSSVLSTQQEWLVKKCLIDINKLEFGILNNKIIND